MIIAVSRDPLPGEYLINTAAIVFVETDGEPADRPADGPAVTIHTTAGSRIELGGDEARLFLDVYPSHRPAPAEPPDASTSEATPPTSYFDISRGAEALRRPGAEPHAYHCKACNLDFACEGAGKALADTRCPSCGLSLYVSYTTIRVPRQATAP